MTGNPETNSKDLDTIIPQISLTKITEEERNTSKFITWIISWELNYNNDMQSLEQMNFLKYIQKWSIKLSPEKYEILTKKNSRNYFLLFCLISWESWDFLSEETKKRLRSRKNKLFEMIIKFTYKADKGKLDSDILNKLKERLELTDEKFKEYTR